MKGKRKKREKTKRNRVTKKNDHVTQFNVYMCRFYSRCLQTGTSI